MPLKTAEAEAATQAEAAPVRLDGLNLAGWAVFLAVAGYVFLFLLPAKGTDFTDEGWYLQASLAAATGKGYDSLLPQSPFYLVNTFFIHIGLGSYLHLRYAYHAVILACMALLARGLEGRRPLAYPTSLGLAVCLLATLTSLLSYENSPLLFGLAGIGLYFTSREEGERRHAAALRLLAGASLGLACFINPTTLPVAALLLAGAFLADRTAGAAPRLPLLPAVGTAVVFSGLFGWYLGRIGLAAFLTMPATYGVRLEKILSVLEYTLQWPILLGVFFGALRGVRGLSRFWPRTGRRNGERLEERLTWWLLALLTLCLAAFMAALAGYGTGKTLAASAFRAAGMLGLSWIGRTPELLSFQLMIFFGFGFLTLALLGCSRAHTAFPRALAAAGGIVLYWCNQEILSAAVVSLKTFFAGPLFFTAFFLLHSRARQADGNRAGIRVIVVFACALTVTACALFTSVNFSHPGHISPLGAKAAANLPRLEGLRDTPERAELLQKLAAAYETYGCADKTLITFQKTSLLGYLFDRKLPDGLSYIWPHFRFPEARLREEIESGKPWCVFVSKNGENDENWLRTKPFLDYLAARSQHVEIIRAEGGADPANPFVLYVGPAAVP